MPFNKRILITIFQWTTGHAALAKPEGIETTQGGTVRACRRIPGDLLGGTVSCLSVCAEAGQGMVFHQRLSLDGVNLAQVSREWQYMADLSQRHQTRFHAVRARFSRWPLVGDHCVKPCWKNRPTLKLWRESPDSERKSPTIPPPHHQGFWRKARKYSGISKPPRG